MKTIECKNCGSPNLIYKNGLVVCQSCDSKFLANEIGWKITSEPKFVTLHSVPGLKKSQNIEAYKNGEQISNYDGHKDVKISLDTDSTFYFKVKGARGITAKVNSTQNSHICLWADQYWGRLDGLKSSENEAVLALKKRDELVSKSKQKLFIHILSLLIPGVNLISVLAYAPWYLINYFGKRKIDIEI